MAATPQPLLGVNLPPDTVQFFRHLWRTQSGPSFVYWWRSDNKNSVWFNAADPIWQDVPTEDADLYFSVHPSATIPNDAPRHKVRSRISTISAINCLFAEFDQVLGATLETVKALCPSPSVIVFSGGGWHCYWLIDEPMPIIDEASRTFARDIQRRWVALQGGDINAKDLPRVLRIPGSTNRKPGRNNARVSFVEYDMDNAYSLDYLVGKLPVETPVILSPPAPAEVQTNGHTNGNGNGDYSKREKWIEAAISSELAELRSTTSGKRNAQLNSAAFSIGQIVAGNGLSRTEAERNLLDAALFIGLEEAEANATIASGMRSGGANPRPYKPSEPIRRYLAPVQEEPTHDEPTHLTEFLDNSPTIHSHDNEEPTEPSMGDTSPVTFDFVLRDYEKHVNERIARDLARLIGLSAEEVERGVTTISANALRWIADTSIDPAKLQTQIIKAAKAAGMADAKARTSTIAGMQTGRQAGRLRLHTYHGTQTHAPGRLPGGQVTESVLADMTTWGYTLAYNTMTGTVECNGKALDDMVRSDIRMAARGYGYSREQLVMLDDAINVIAGRNHYSPVVRYLDSLEWDGVDRMGDLFNHIVTKDPLITYPDGTTRTTAHAFGRRWMIGMIAKHKGDDGAIGNNFMLVLAGAQGRGKSYFFRWLCPLPEYWDESELNPDDKDHQLKHATRMIWEVGELDAVTSKRNTSALKAGITRTRVSVRKAYARMESSLRGVCSYVGGVNPDGAGFLNDSTGNRRFAVITVDTIRYEYTGMDRDQIYAQAVAEWKKEPTGYLLTEEEKGVRDMLAEAHTPSDALADMVASHFDIDASIPEWRLTTTEIFKHLADRADYKIPSHLRAAGRELAQCLTRHWRLTVKRSNGSTVYLGIKTKP